MFNKLDIVENDEPAERSRVRTIYERFLWGDIYWWEKIAFHSKVDTIIRLGTWASIFAVSICVVQLFVPGGFDSVGWIFAKIICSLCILAELFVHWCRSPSSSAFGRRYLLDLLAAICPLFTIFIVFESVINYIHPGYLAFHGICESYLNPNTYGDILFFGCEVLVFLPKTFLHLAGAFSILRLNRFALWLNSRTQRGELIEQEEDAFHRASANLQSNAFLLSIAFFVIFVLSVGVHDLVIVRSSNQLSKEITSNTDNLGSHSNAENPTFKPVPINTLLKWLQQFAKHTLRNSEQTVTQFWLIVVGLFGTLLVAQFSSFMNKIANIFIDRYPADRWRISDLKGHVVICGVHDSILSLVRDLKNTLGFKNLPFVFISSEKNPPHYKKLIKILSDELYHIRGDFTQATVLETAQIKEAHCAIVVADIGESSTPPGQNELNRDRKVVFAALSIETANPKIISIIERLRSDDEELLAAKSIEANINRNELTGRALGLAAWHPGLSRVLSDLLTYNEGVSLEIELRSPGNNKHENNVNEGYKPVDFNFPKIHEEYRQRTVSLLGTIRSVEEQQNQERKVELGTQNSSNESLITGFVILKNAVQDIEKVGQKYCRSIETIQFSRNFLILGWSAAGLVLLEEIALGCSLGEFEPREVHIRTFRDKDRIKEQIADIEKELKKHGVEVFVKTEPVDGVNYEEINNGQFGRIVLLADTLVADATVRDARTVFLGLALYYRFKNRKDSERPHIVVELMLKDNARSFWKTDVEVVLRNELSGGALAAACRHPNLIDVPNRLITLKNGGYRLTVIRKGERDIEWTEDEPEDMTFGELAKRYWHQGVILLGFEVDKKEDQPDKSDIDLFRLRQNLNPEEETEIPRDARLIAIVENLTPPTLECQLLVGRVLANAGLYPLMNRVVQEFFSYPVNDFLDLVSKPEFEVKRGVCKSTLRDEATRQINNDQAIESCSILGVMYKQGEKENLSFASEKLAWDENSFDDLDILYTKKRRVSSKTKSSIECKNLPESIIIWGWNRSGQRLVSELIEIFRKRKNKSVVDLLIITGEYMDIRKDFTASWQAIEELSGLRIIKKATDVLVDKEPNRNKIDELFSNVFSVDLIYVLAGKYSSAPRTKDETAILLATSLADYFAESSMEPQIVVEVFIPTNSIPQKYDNIELVSRYQLIGVARSLYGKDKRLVSIAAGILGSSGKIRLTIIGKDREKEIDSKYRPIRDFNSYKELCATYLNNRFVVAGYVSCSEHDDGKRICLGPKVDDMMSDVVAIIGFRYMIDHVSGNGHSVVSSIDKVRYREGPGIEQMDN